MCTCVLCRLLAILSKTRDPTAVQPHLRKCFDSIMSIVFAEQNTTEVLAMVSAEGEVVNFTETVVTKGSVEDWLNAIEAMMCLTIKTITKYAQRVFVLSFNNMVSIFFYFCSIFMWQECFDGISCKWLDA
jgi:hypothetical protein